MDHRATLLPMIEDGATLQEMAVVIGRTRERVRQLLLQWHVRDRHREARQRRQEAAQVARAMRRAWAPTTLQVALELLAQGIAVLPVRCPSPGHLSRIELRLPWGVIVVKTSRYLLRPNGPRYSGYYRYFFRGAYPDVAAALLVVPDGRRFLLPRRAWGRLVSIPERWDGKHARWRVGLDGDADTMYTVCP